MTTNSRCSTIGEGLRWAAFRLLESVAAAATTKPSRPLGPQNAIKCLPSIWIFASTIGELNVIKSFIPKLRKAIPAHQLVFISDHGQYRENYERQYPGAVFFHSKGASKDAESLVSLCPPRLLIIAEIPCMLSDAPCRFTYPFVRTAKNCGAPVVIVNGWLYGQMPSCRLDAWEKRLFLGDFLRSIDLACVQTSETADRLISQGLDPAKTITTGSMKFDALAAVEGWSPRKTRSPEILTSLTDGSRSVIVAGCIKKSPEQTLIIEAFKRVIEVAPNSLLVFAHRHPEIQKNIQTLSAELSSQEIHHVFRSKNGDKAPKHNIQCLVLDTMGELSDFYATATVAHVGVDHNLLEPLAFGKPISTPAIWCSTFPNYAIFQSLLSLGVIFTADDPLSLSAQWLEWIKNPAAAAQQRARLELLATSDATEKTVQEITKRFVPLTSQVSN